MDDEVHSTTQTKRAIEAKSQYLFTQNRVFRLYYDKLIELTLLNIIYSKILIDLNIFNCVCQPI